MKPRNKAAKIFGSLLILAGLAGLGIWLWSYLALDIVQQKENRAFEQDRAAVEQSRPVTDEGGLVGRLTIPRLDVRAIVREGAREKTLSVALGHIPGTAFPGPGGNVGIAGHRDRLFRALKDISVGDQILFETPSATYTYQVESTRIVKPIDVWVLNASVQPELTLVTCYPFYYVGSAPDRFIVRARLISSTRLGGPAGKEPPESPSPATVRKVALAPPARTEDPKPRPRPLSFTIAEGHSRELVPGKIWFGVSSTDEAQQRVNGWVWVMPDRRTFWMESVDVNQPYLFSDDGELRRLTITSITSGSATGHLNSSRSE